jgi:hypothetical protein
MICKFSLKQGNVKASDIYKIIKKSSGKYLAHFSFLERSEVFMAVRMKTGIPFDVITFCQSAWHQYFGRICYLYNGYFDLKVFKSV